jgi:ABC-type Fe3+-siderophore transport system permease subunit
MSEPTKRKTPTPATSVSLRARLLPAGRPRSIERFELLYLASFAVSLLGWAFSWQSTADRLAIDPKTQAFGWLLPAALLLSGAITILLWYLIARRASLAAKWVATILTGLAVVRFVINLGVVLRGPVPIVATLLSAAIVVLSVAATVQLFKADARAWFGEDASAEDDAA